VTYVSDTHPFVYHVTKRKRLGRRARTIFDRADHGTDTIIVPFTVLEEVMLLSEVGKISLPMPFRELVVTLGQSANFDLGVNDSGLLLEAATFTTIRDPYDRLIIAQARVAGVPLITADERIHDSGLVGTLWD
jgi:PIN domain nuclease of toxin-antitoxin system